MVVAKNQSRSFKFGSSVCEINKAMDKVPAVLLARYFTDVMRLTVIVGVLSPA